MVGLLLVIAVLALGFGSFRAGHVHPTTAAATTAPVSTMTGSHDPAPVATAAPMPERTHLVDRRPDRTTDGLVIALAILLVIGAARRGPANRPAALDAAAPAGPSPATLAWHRRGPPHALLT